MGMIPLPYNHHFGLVTSVLKQVVDIYSQSPKKVARLFFAPGLVWSLDPIMKS